MRRFRVIEFEYRSSTPRILRRIPEMRFGRSRNTLFSFLCVVWLLDGFGNSALAQDNSKSDSQPLILGFEGFYAPDKTADPAAGRLLLSELSCTACHKTDDATIGRKQAPILDGVGQR